MRAWDESLKTPRKRQFGNGLYDIVISAKFEGLLDIVSAMTRRHYNNGRLGSFWNAISQGQELKTVHIGHVQVQQNAIRLIFDNVRKAAKAVIGDVYSVSQASKNQMSEIRDHTVVIHDQDRFTARLNLLHRHVTFEKR
nr:hypothetical protein [Asticcacaulis sp. AC466]